MVSRALAFLLTMLIVALLVSPALGHSSHDHQNSNSSSVEQTTIEGEPLAVFSGFVLRGWMIFVTVGSLIALALLANTGFVEEHFEQIFTFGLLWFSFGVIADAYNHLNGAPITFINLEHSVAYSGVMVLVGSLTALVLKGWRSGGLTSNVPEGYKLLLITPLLFAFGILGDMIWHQMFGFEVKPQQMLSPTHLILGVGSILIVTGPLRQAWYNGLGKNWKRQLPMLTSSSLLLSVLTFMIQNFHPFTVPFGSSAFTMPGGVGETAAMLGIAGLTLNTIFIVGLLLNLGERFDIVSGGLTYILGFNALLMTATTGYFEYILVGIVTGILIDIFRTRFSVRKENVLNFRFYSMLIPFIFTTLYFLTMYLTGGIRWTIHVWSGVIFLNSAVGVVTSYAVYPSAYRYRQN